MTHEEMLRRIEDPPEEVLREYRRLVSLVARKLTRTELEEEFMSFYLLENPSHQDVLDMLGGLKEEWADVIGRDEVPHVTGKDEGAESLPTVRCRRCGRDVTRMMQYPVGGRDVICPPCFSQING